MRRFHQTNIHHTCTELHVYKHIFTAYSTQEQIQATAHQFFFWNDSFNSTPDDILNDSRFPYFRDVQNREQQKPPATSWHILAKLLVKELYELIEIQVAITINIHELKKNLHVRGGVAPFC